MKCLMLAVLGFVIFLLSQVPGSCTEDLPRHKRGVLDMVVTLWCYRNKLKVPLLGINLYGCYCGTGGRGVPVDAVDQCCFLHDCCYHHSRVVLECHSKVKWEFYNFSCGRDHTKCTSASVCGRMACECDKQFAECLSRARPKRKHFFYNRKDLCLGPKGVCPQIFPDATEIFQWPRNFSREGKASGNNATIGQEPSSKMTENTQKRKI